MGTDVERRLTRLEIALKADECVCGGQSDIGACEILIVEEGWNEERILAEEASRPIACPVHGVQAVSVLRLSGSDIDG